MSQIGKTFPWRDYPGVQLVSEFKALECKICHNLILSAADTARLDETLIESINSTTKKFIEMTVEKAACSQVEVAAHLGVTKEYLSEIKSGRKQPSFQIFNFLKTIALGNDAFVISSPKFDISTRLTA